MMKNLIFITSLTLLLFTFGCKKPEIQVSDDLMTLQINESEENIENLKTKIHKAPESTKKLYILLGYGFNTAKNQKTILSLLDENFGLDENGGLIVPVIFPDNLHSRIMNFYDIVKGKDSYGIILLGAPERTNFMLEKVLDEWDEYTEQNIFSFFPQEETLGQEANCTALIDYERHITSDNHNLEEEVLKIDSSFYSMLLSTIEYMIYAPGVFEKNTELYEHVKQMLSTNTLKHYTDAESNLTSINHFIINGGK